LYGEELQEGNGVNKNYYQHNYIWFKNIKQMKNLSLQTQGVKGGQTKIKNNNGYIMVNCEEHRITFDNFTGSGEYYKQRENPLIEIVEKGEVKFSGNLIELIERLKS
jgi:hypothetical protein